MRFKSNYFIPLLSFSCILLIISLVGMLDRAAKKTPSPKPRIEFEGDPEKRREWFFRQRAYPFEDVPPDGRRMAWEARPKGRLEPLAAQVWQQLGPSPTVSAVPNNWGVTSGRINAIAVSPADPNIILVGASTGGVWRSTDGGVNFVPTSDDQVDLAVGSVAFSQSSPQIVYSGMGDPKLNYLGSGVLKSTDAGATWKRISNQSLPTPGISTKIEVDPLDPNRVYLAQFARFSNGNIFSSGFFLSTDGGVNWRKTLTGLAKDLVVDAANPRTLYLGMSRVDESGSPPAGLYRSTDGGENWNILFSAPYGPNSTFEVKAATTRADPRTIYVYTGGFIDRRFDVRVVLSTDGGTSWTNRGSNDIDTGQFGYNTYIFADPNNARTVYVGARDVYKSTDNGLNFKNLNGNFVLPDLEFTPDLSNTHPDQHSLAFSPNDSNVIYVGNDGGISKSTDGGNSFASLNASLILQQFYALTLDPLNPKLSYAGSQDNGLQRREDGTKQWRELITGDYGNIVINPRDTNVFFANFVFGNIFRFRSGEFDDQVAGNSTFGESETSPRIAFLAPLVGNETDSTLYFGTSRLFVSRNLGGSWSALGGGIDLTKGQGDVLNAIAVSRSNVNVIYTGSARGRAMASTDGGARWNDVTTGLPDRFISAIEIDSADPATAYLTVSGFGSGHVFRTRNFGANWTDVSGNLPDIPTNAILIDPLNSSVIYAGTDIGVFRSTTGGGKWETFNDGLPPVVVMAFASNQSGLIQLATYGRGVYELTGTPNTDATPPTVNVTSPNGRESLIAGSRFTIGWTSTDNQAVARHDITLSTDSGSTFPVTIAAGLAGDAQSFVWTVPQIDAARARVRVAAADPSNNEGADASDADFRIAPAAASDFTLDVSPASQNVISGGSASFALNVRPLGSFTQNVNLTATISPANGTATATITPNSVAPGNAAALTVSAAANAPSGTFAILVTGTAGGLTRTVNATVNVVAPDFSLSFNSPQIELKRKLKGQFTVNVNRAGGFAGNVTVAPDADKLKALKIKVVQPSLSTSGASVSFDFKVKQKAPLGTQQLIFAGRDDAGRVRTAALTLVIR